MHELLPVVKLNQFLQLVLNLNEKMLKKIWQTPQYKFSDKLNIIFHPYYSSRYLWDDMKEINLFHQAPAINVPVYFLLGRHDRIVSSEIAAEYYRILDANEGKHLVWFEASAHRPHLEEPAKFFDLLVNVVLPQTANRLQMMVPPVAEGE